MRRTIDCGEGRHDCCGGSSDQTYLIPQMNGQRFSCQCPCHEPLLDDYVSVEPDWKHKW